MNWLRMVGRAWSAVLAQLRRFRLHKSAGGGNMSRRNDDDDGACSGSGLLKLQDDVKLCGYEDVRILWDILSKTESAQTTSDRQRGKRAIIGSCKRRVRRADCSMSTAFFGQSIQPLSHSLSL